MTGLHILKNAKFSQVYYGHLCNKILPYTISIPWLNSVTTRAIISLLAKQSSLFKIAITSPFANAIPLFMASYIPSSFSLIILVFLIDVLPIIFRVPSVDSPSINMCS